MAKPELLKMIVVNLQRLEIEYMLTGSLASSLQGEPRSTFDMDFLLSIEEEDISSFIKAFPNDSFFLDREGMKEAIEEEERFMLLDLLEGERVDFWILTDSPFDLSRLSRSYKEEIMGMEIIVTSPEDTILGKLRWTLRLGGSEKHFLDALRVYEVQKPLLDKEYLEEWAQRLGVEEYFQRLEDAAQAP